MDGQADHQTPDGVPLVAEPEDQSPSLSPIAQAGYSTPRGRMATRPAWGPDCSHSTLARVYHPGFRCVQCNREPQLGWIYRCTMDREALIFNAKLEGQEAGFDELGRAFAEHMTLGRYGADVRTAKYAFLREITTDQLHSYTPNKLITLLSQRDNVIETIAKSRRQLGHPVVWYAGLKYPDDTRPWMPNHAHECQYKVCHLCHSIGKDKCWVSLNAVLNGDILPSVATGYAFSYAGSRPLINVQVAKNLGCRPVPFPTLHPVILARMARMGWGDVDGHINDNVDSWFLSDRDGSSDHPLEPTDIEADDTISDSDESLDTSDEFPGDCTPSTLKPESNGDDDESDIEDSALDYTSMEDCCRDMSPADLHIRAPWTPPPTPGSQVTEGYHDDCSDSDSADEYNGRSPSSLKMNPMVRLKLFSSFPSIGSVLEKQPGNDCYKPEEDCDVGLGLPLNDRILERACNTPLPKPDLSEEFLFAKGKISIGDFKHTLGSAYSATVTAPVPAPAVIRLPDEEVAVALLTEESVEVGTPDLVLCAEAENADEENQSQSSSG